MTFALRVVKTVLLRLLADGDYQYKDTRIVAALLRVHMVLCSAPQSSVVSNATPDVSALFVCAMLIIVSLVPRLHPLPALRKLNGEWVEPGDEAIVLLH